MKPPARLSSVILWSVISAAFIGPGTVTTAVSAGSQYGVSLLWAISFATLACIALQEISARIAIASGLTLGESLMKKFGPQKGKSLQWIVGGSVVMGCAAYEAGNMLGAVAGLQLVTSLPEKILTVVVAIGAGLVLWWGGKQWISHLMTLLVVVMGGAFAAVAFAQPFQFTELLAAAVVPAMPAGAGMLVLGLVGTTIVPYNIFLGAGISKGETIPLMRVGLIVSICIGGLITAAILLAGVSVSRFSSFSELGAALGAQTGTWASTALALGLFAAGFSSAITSPYASSVIATTVFGTTRAWVAKLVAAGVLLIGFAFGISGVKPIPVILMVQALNGLLLPLLTFYLIWMVNDVSIVPRQHQHGRGYNFILLLILFAVSVIGLHSISRSIGSAFGFEISNHLQWVIAVAAIATGYASLRVFRKESAIGN